MTHQSQTQIVSAVSRIPQGYLVSQPPGHFTTPPMETEAVSRMTGEAIASLRQSVKKKKCIN